MADVRAGIQRAIAWQACQEPNYLEFEKSWTEQRNTYPVEPTGDSASIAAAILSGGVN